MSALQELFRKITNLYNKVTDWLLILIGVALVVKATTAIDVVIAKYAVIVAGVLLTALGFWYRHRRKRQHRVEQER